jgi:hypothetical protein
MKSRQSLVRLALMFLTASPPILSLSSRLLADDQPANPSIVPAGSNIPRSNLVPVIENDEAPLELPVFPPKSGRGSSRSLEIEERDSESDALPPRKRSQGSHLLPTTWRGNARLIPTQIDAEVIGIDSSDADEPTHPSTASTPHVMRKKRSTKGSSGTGGTTGIKKAVYTQPTKLQQAARPVNQASNRSPEPLIGALFFPILNVNAGLGVATFSKTLSTSPEVRQSVTNPWEPSRKQPAEHVVAEPGATKMTAKKGPAAASHAKSSKVKPKPQPETP